MQQQKYTTILTDPPWPIADPRQKQVPVGHGGRVAFNREGIGAKVARAWGYEPLREFIWAKKSFGMGTFPRPQHEILMVCRRGKLDYGPRDVGSVQWWNQPRAQNNGGKIHSAKPDAAIDMIELASPGPYLELFARQNRMGWDTWGDQCFNDIELTTNTST